MQDLQEWAEQSQSSEDYRWSNWRLKAIDAWNRSGRASRKKSKRQMEATVSIKWYDTQKLNLFASMADKCEPSSSAFEWRTEGSTKPISAYTFNSEAT